MSDRAAIKNLIFYFGVAVVAIVAFNSYLFFKKPNVKSVDINSQLESSPSSTSSSARRPASIDSVKVAESTLTVLCGADHDFAELAENQVQLKFEKCRGYFVKSITNRKNGSSAMIFSVGDYDFVTDFLQIDSGINEIEVVTSGITGTKVSLLKIPKKIQPKSGD